MAATPAGLQAMEELAKLEESRRSLKGIASNEMCNFLILNISSLQLIPVNVIAYRSQYGSVNPGIDCRGGDYCYQYQHFGGDCLF